MRNLSEAEITQANSLVFNLIGDKDRVTNNFDNRIFYSSLIKRDGTVSNRELCHDILLGLNSDYQGGLFNNKLLVDNVLFFVPSYYRNHAEITEKFTLFMEEIKSINNLTDEELGAFTYISTTNNDFQCFGYKFGTIFQQSRGFAYIPLKLFRLAIMCNIESKSIVEAMKLNSNRYIDHNDRAIYRDFSDKVYTCLSNLRDVHFPNNFFLADIRIAAKDLEQNILLKKRKEEAEAKKMKKLEEIKAKVLRTKEVPIMVLSRHPSHAPLRQLESSCRILVRLGSTTETPPKMVDKCVEINSIVGVQTSSSKIRMKRAFAKNNIQTSAWILPENEQEIRQFAAQFAEKKNVKYVSKSEFGSRGEGNRLHDNVEDLISFFNTGNKYGRYIVEKYYSYNKEYRLHVSSRGVCFYTCRKMLKSGTPEDQKWVRNDSTCVWILEENELFGKPKTWDQIVQASINAINAVGLDVGAVDVRVNNEGQFIILETNSAPSFGDLTLDKYYEEIPLLAWDKMLKMSQV